MSSARFPTPEQFAASGFRDATEFRAHYKAWVARGGFWQAWFRAGVRPVLMVESKDQMSRPVDAMGNYDARGWEACVPTAPGVWWRKVDPMESNVAEELAVVQVYSYEDVQGAVALRWKLDRKYDAPVVDDGRWISPVLKPLWSVKL